VAKKRYGLQILNYTAAVGSERFVQGILEKLAPKAPGRKARELTDHYELREQGAIYNAHFSLKKQF
jgi:hypothetical protein